MAAYNAALFASSGLMASFLLAKDFYSFAVVAVLYGISIGGPSSQMNLVLGELFGIDSLNSTFGILCFFRGVFFFLSWPIAAFVFEYFESQRYPPVNSTTGLISFNRNLLTYMGVFGL